MPALIEAIDAPVTVKPVTTAVPTLADAAGDNFKKGQSILVVGKVKISKYEDKNGVERQSVEILADEIAAVVKGSKAVTAPTDDPWL